MDEQLTMDEVEILTTLDFADAWGMERNAARLKAQRRAKELGIETVPARSPRGHAADAYSRSDGERIIAAQRQKESHLKKNLSSKKKRAEEIAYQIGTAKRPDVMTVFEIAELLNVTRSHAARYARKYEKKISIRRLEEVRSDKANKITAYRRSDGERLVQHIIELRIAKTTGRAAKNRSKLAREEIPQPKVPSSKNEVFYLIDLIPNKGGFYKIGQTNDIEQRKRDHRTPCPNLRVIKTWPCKRAQDNEATRYALKFSGLQDIKSETFWTQDIQGLVKYLDNYFKST